MPGISFVSGMGIRRSDFLRGTRFAALLCCGTLQIDPNVSHFKCPLADRSSGKADLFPSSLLVASLPCGGSLSAPEWEPRESVSQVPTVASLHLERFSAMTGHPVAMGSQ